MRATILSAALLAAAAPGAVPAASPVPAPAAARDWSQRVEVTAEGGYRMGNPDAPVKLVEYASITCSHCAAFNAQASQPLRERHVRSGRVSWEVRPFLIFASDTPIFRLLQCQAPAQFFDLSDKLFADQAVWNQRLVQGSASLKGIPPRDQGAAIVRLSQVDRLFRERGMTDAQIASCLSDRAGINQLEALTNRYSAAGVTGTPAFYINGHSMGNLAWPQLENIIAVAAPS